MRPLCGKQKGTFNRKGDEPRKSQGGGFGEGVLGQDRGRLDILLRRGSTVCWLRKQEPY